MQIRQAIRINKELDQINTDLQKEILRTASYQPGRILKSYLDDTDHDICRIVVYQMANYEDVFYVMEAVNEDNEIEQVYRSTIYPSFSALEPKLKGMIEIKPPLSSSSPR